MNQVDPFAAVRIPGYKKQDNQDVSQQQRETMQEEDPFAAVRAVQKKQSNWDYAKEFPKAAIRGVGHGVANVLERSARTQEEASLPALLGMKPDVSIERNIAKSIRENIPEGSQNKLPNILEKGVEIASDPASWIGGGPVTAFAMGATGEAIKQAGGPKWLQIAGEIGVTLLKKSPGKVYTDASPEIREAQALMRAQGLAEDEIVLATNAIKDKTAVEGIARMTKSAEKQFESTKGSLEKGVNDIISDSFPGFEKGIVEVEKRANALFEPVNQEASNLIIGKSEKFNNAVESIVQKIKNTLANTPDEVSFISMLETAKNNAISGRSADNYVNFYQTLNRIGKWVDPSKKEAYMKEAKDAIKATFRDNGPAGNKLANNFEKANEGWVKLHKAEEVNNIIKKSFVDERMDFTKLSKSLSNEQNYSSLKNAVGNESAANVKLMSKIGRDVERSAKAIEGGMGKQGIIAAKGFGVVTSLMSLNPAVIVGTMGSALSISSARYLATQLLVNPKYQHLWMRMADKVKSGSSAQAVILAKQLEKMAEKDFNDRLESQEE